MIRSRDLSNNDVGGLSARPAASARARVTSARADTIVDLATHTQPTVTVAELAAYWRVTPRTILRDISKRALPAFRLPGGDLRVLIVDARTYGRPVE